MSELCQHELPIDLLESLLLPRCQKCGRVMRDVQQAVTDQHEREQRAQAKPVTGEAWRGDTNLRPPPPGASKEEVARYRRHQRMKQRGQADQIGYRGG